MKRKLRNRIASRLGVRSQCEMGIELGRDISEAFSKGITNGYEGGRRMNNVNERDIELKRFFKEMPVTAPQTTVGFKRLTDTAVLPTKAHPTDSGFDLFADETVIIEPGQTVVVKTGIAVVLPEGYEATVRPRSGITSRTKLRVQLGTVDNAYRGDIGIIVDNIACYAEIAEIPSMDDFYVVYGINGKYHHATDKAYEGGSYIIRIGDKLAQLVVSPVAPFAGVEITDLDVTDRGGNGFGSTGVTNKEDE